MTKDEIDTLLAKLTRYTDGGDYEGGYMMHERPDGMYVEFDDVRELLESIVPAFCKTARGSIVGVDGPGYSPYAQGTGSMLAVSHEWRGPGRDGETGPV